MTFQIKLKPSGHIVEQEGKETILRSGMRAGLNLAHNCMNGSCGKCQGKLLQGELIQTRHHDFALNEQQKQENYFLTCCHQPASDIVIEMHETNAAQDKPFQEIKAKVSRVEYLAEHVASLNVRTSRSKVLDFLAGQKALVCIDDELCHEFGIASCPCDGLNLRFHVYNQGSGFSETFFNHLKKGRPLTIKGPVGKFTIDEDFQGPLVFIAWNTGFAQVQSMIEHVISHDLERQISLYWFVDDFTGDYLKNYCRAWNDVLDGFQYEIIQTQSVPDALGELFNKTITDDLNAESQVYAALPVEHKAGVIELLEKQFSVLPDKVFFEAVTLHD